MEILAALSFVIPWATFIFVLILLNIKDWRDENELQGEGDPDPLPLAEAVEYVPDPLPLAEAVEHIPDPHSPRLGPAFDDPIFDSPESAPDLATQSEANPSRSEDEFRPLDIGRIDPDALRHNIILADELYGCNIGAYSDWMEFKPPVFGESYGSVDGVHFSFRWFTSVALETVQRAVDTQQALEHIVEINGHTELARSIRETLEQVTQAAYDKVRIATNLVIVAGETRTPYSAIIREALTEANNLLDEISDPLSKLAQQPLPTTADLLRATTVDARQQCEHLKSLVDAMLDGTRGDRPVLLSDIHLAQPDSAQLDYSRSNPAQAEPAVTY